MRNSFNRPHNATASAFLRAFAQIDHPSTPDAEITSDDLANQLVARFNRRAADWTPTDGPVTERAEFRAWRTIRTLARRAGDLHIYAQLRKPRVGGPLLLAQVMRRSERHGID